MPKAELPKKPTTSSQGSKAHPWRACPLGKYWVRAHSRNRVSSKGKPYTQQMPGTCRPGPSHKDHLYRDEIHEVAARNFQKLNGPPTKRQLIKGVDGNAYDEIIRGWTQYWNAVLKPADPLGADVVKALIASESGFNPLAWNHLKGKNSAYGLMQVTLGSVQLLKDPKELKDHFVNLASADMKDPNLSICAGVRWLFRKKELYEFKQKKSVSWREAIREYKGYKTTDKEQKGMGDFNRYLAQLEGKK
jgi:hypothetical protein